MKKADECIICCLRNITQVHLQIHRGLGLGILSLKKVSTSRSTYILVENNANFPYTQNPQIKIREWWWRWISFPISIMCSYTLHFLAVGQMADTNIIIMNLRLLIQAENLWHLQLAMYLKSWFLYFFTNIAYIDKASKNKNMFDLVTKVLSSSLPRFCCPLTCVLSTS